MYCAQCGAEYREGFTECNTCLIPLVESAARQPLPNDSQWSPTTRLGSKGTRLIFFTSLRSLLLELASRLNGGESERLG